MYRGERRGSRERAPQEARHRHQSVRLDRSQTLALSTSLQSLRTDLLAILDAGLRSCDPERLLLRALAGAGVPPARVLVVAAGKAAPLMAKAALRAFGASVRGGVVVGPTAAAVPPPLETVVAGHPIPTTESERAGRRALEIAGSARAGDLLLVLLSGGASALLALPAAGLTLEDKRATTDRLLKAGADIFTLNAVRKHLSAVKGGQLAAATAAVSRTFAISDVVGDDLSVIGSGPTVGDPTTFADALAALERSGGLDVFPSPVVVRLTEGAGGRHPETPKPGDARLERASAHVIGSRYDAMRGAADEARRRGYHVTVVEEPVTGEARTAGTAWADRLARAKQTVPSCAISSGETTVRVTGAGRGGRNQEFTLAAASVLAGLERQAVGASIGTDGIDGPTDAAGAVADSTTLERAARAGLSPEGSLADNDSNRFFAGLGDLVTTGPTGTNVGDLQVLLIG